VRLTCTNISNGRKTPQVKTDGSPSIRASVSSLWGPKTLESIVPLNLCFEVETEKSVLRRLDRSGSDSHSNEVRVVGLISKFTVGGGRTGTDRQFFFVNGRPCVPSKVQKAFNEVYRTFNANQSPFIVADFILPRDSLDINVSPDKRTIFIHSENNLVQALKTALEETFSNSRSTFDVNATQPTPKVPAASHGRKETPLFLEGDDDDGLHMGTDEPFSMGESSLLIQSMDAGDPLDTSMGTAPEQSLQPLSPDVLPPEPEQTSSSNDIVPDSPDTSIEDIMLPTPTSLLSDNPRSHMSAGPESPIANDRDLDNEASPLVVSHDEDPVPPIPSLRAPTSTPPNVETTTLNRSYRNRSSKPGTSLPKVQMVLSTENASWNLRRGSEDVHGRPSKRPRTSSPTRSIAGVREAIKERLTGFALPGSQLSLPRTAEDSDEENDEAIEPTESADIEVEDDVMSVDIVDETMDLGEPEDIVNESERSLNSTGDRAVAGRVDAGDLVDLTQDADTLEDDEDSSEIPPRPRDRPHAHDQLTHPEIVRSLEGDDISMHLDLSQLNKSWQHLQERVAQRKPNESEMEITATVQVDLKQSAGIENADYDKAAEALSRVIDKADFASMEVVGQFNKGFIIARRKKGVASESDSEDGNIMDDLFIVDQHAADEKYNFEDLQLKTKIESQKLYQPRHLELTASDELLAIENIDVLSQNGFEVDVDESGDSGGSRVKLIAQPISNSTVFDMKDLEELLHLMQDQPTGTMVRCSKARAMFAMRACRKSIMVGDVLKYSQMISVVRHMGDMNQPWNCPHGRPTMRHLSDIRRFGRSRDYSSPDRQRIVCFDSLV